MAHSNTLADTTPSVDLPAHISVIPRTTALILPAVVPLMLPLVPVLTLSKRTYLHPRGKTVRCLPQPNGDTGEEMT